MSKEQEEDKALNKELHKSINKPITDKIHEAVVFVKKLVATLFALAIGFLGGVAILYATKHLTGINWTAVIVAGSCAVVDSLYLLYMALMKVGK